MKQRRVEAVPDYIYHGIASLITNRIRKRLLRKEVNYMQQIQREIKTEKRTVSPVAVGLTGILIGAAGVAAVALSDQETRKKATRKAKQMRDDLQKWSSKTIHDMQLRGEEIKTSARGKLEAPKTEISKEVKERLNEDPLE